MATLTYDPSDDPQMLEADEVRDAESLEIGERLEQEQQALLAGKFKDASELEQAYIELQKKLGSRDPDEPEVKQEVPQQDEEDPTVSFLSSAADEYERTGDLSPETMEAFGQMSSQELVQAYVKLQASMDDAPPISRDLSDGEINQIKNSVGGEAAYSEMVSWAAENFAPNEIEAFDSVVESGNVGAINLALQALYFRYTDAVGFEGKTLQGKPAKAASNAFRSQAEVVRAMSDPRYENDPAYRQDVFDKLERSNLEF